MTALPQFDGCQVVEKVRSGPVADVFLATQQPLGRSVLIKALIPNILPSSPFAAMLEREARLLAELDHPNILHLHDFVRQNDRMWLVLEHVDGWALDELLKKTGALAPAAAAQVALSLARALDHAHNLGIVHRDVQPKNVLVSRRGQVKLTGFSVAVDERLPTAPELLDGGTSFHGPMYMSPEQVLGEPPDPRSDLFSLGIVLYEMLSGAQPFAAPDDRSATQRIRHDPAPPLSRAAPQVPPVLERVVQRCLEKMPSDRFQSAAELAHALESTGSELGPGAVQGALRSALERAGLSPEVRKSLGEIAPPVASVRRRPSLFPALRGLLLCFALLVAGGGVIQYFAWRAEGVPAARGGIGKLELVPRRQGFLRVVADPWAHVFVDGQRVDTTPFARPIPLEAGIHYVKLEHPQAPTERRTVRIAPNETVLLDVKMKLYAPKIDAGAEDPEELLETTDAGSDAPPSP
jgi:eukaryotic-like serine/threonine-protein kinase